MDDGWVVLAEENKRKMLRWYIKEGPKQGQLILFSFSLFHIQVSYV